jgi:hypothetical protein
MSTALDEAALRRDTFTEGPKVRLGDGQIWTFPTPFMCMHTQIGPEGTVHAVGSLSYGRTYLDRLDDMIEAEDDLDRVCVQLELAASLLLRNYALDNRALRRLISIDLDTDPEMWPAIQDVLFGRHVPKPSADGSGAPSGPSASTSAV